MALKIEKFIQEMSQPDDNLIALPTLREFRSTLRARIQEKLDLMWKHEDKGAWTRRLIPTWVSTPISSKMYSKRGSVRQLQMISGHYQCNAFRHRTKQIGSPLCRHGCECDESITHILLHCPHYSTQRDTLLSTLATHDLQPSVRNMLIHERATIATQIFLSSIDIGG